MSNFINWNENGIQIVSEKVYVANKTNVKFLHDNWFDLKMYTDETLAIQIDETLYSCDENSYDKDYKGYNSLVLTEEIYNNYIFVYVAYKTKGDYVEAEDVNYKNDSIEHRECGENIIANRVVMLNNNKMYYPDMSKISDVWKIIGIAKDSGNQHQKIKVCISGEMTENAWNWDITKNIFVGANGVLTQTCPVETIKIIAIPISSTTIRIVNLNEITRSD